MKFSPHLFLTCALFLLSVKKKVEMKVIPSTPTAYPPERYPPIQICHYGIIWEHWGCKEICRSDALTTLTGSFYSFWISRLLPVPEDEPRHSVKEIYFDCLYLWSYLFLSLLRAHDLNQHFVNQSFPLRRICSLLTSTVRQDRRR